MIKFVIIAVFLCPIIVFSFFYIIYKYKERKVFIMIKAQLKVLEKAERYKFPEWEKEILMQDGLGASLYIHIFTFFKAYNTDNNGIEIEYMQSYIKQVFEYVKLFTKDTADNICFYWFKVDALQLQFMEKVIYLIKLPYKEFVTHNYMHVSSFNELCKKVMTMDEFREIITDLVKLHKSLIGNEQIYNYESGIIDIITAFYKKVSYAEIKTYFDYIMEELSKTDNKDYFIQSKALRKCERTIQNKLIDKNFYVFKKNFPYIDKPTEAVSKIHTRTYVPQETGRLIKQLQGTGVSMSAKLKMYSVDWKYEKVLRFTFTTYRTVEITPDSIRPNNIVQQLYIVIYPNGMIYQDRRNKNGSIFIPLSMKALSNYYSADDEFFNDFLNCLCEFTQIKYGTRIFNDCIPYIKKYWLIPVDYNDIVKYHTFEQAFKNKYISVKNWNRNDINILYVTSKVSSYVTEKSKNKVLEYADTDGFYKMLAEYSSNNVNFCRRYTRYNLYKDGIYLFLRNYLQNLIRKKQSDNDIFNILIQMEKIDYESSLKHAYEVAKRYIDDYVRLCLQTKTKVQLNLSSIKRIVELHDELINTKKNREMPTIHIPKNTVYIKLRKLLPKEFEWIKTKKRLLKESEIQHHCVWTYGGKINADKSAIYSFVYAPENKRYTIEFVYSNNGKYKIRQMQSCCDKGHSKEAYEYVKNFL